MAFMMKDEVFAAMREVCKRIYETGKMIKTEDALMELMNMEGILMHCPYHHFIMPAALLTLAAMEDGKSWEELDQWLSITEERARTVPPGFCGNCGACGAAVGVGIFISVYTGGSPLAEDNRQWANEGTGT